MKEENEIAIGQPAPDFALETSDAVTVSLGALRGRAVVVFFVREFT